MPFTLLICLFFGLLWGVLYRAGMALAGFPIDLPLALLGGLLFGLVFFLLILLYDRHQHKRIRLVAQQLPSPPSQTFIVLLVQGKAVQSNTLLLCEDCLCLANMEQKPPAITIIHADEFIRAELSSRSQLTLHLTEGRSLTLRTAACQPLLTALKERGWLPFQH